MAVLAKENGVPFFVAAPISTLDLTLASGDQIPIEQRASAEVTHVFGRQVAPDGDDGREPGVRRDAGALRQRDHHGAGRGASAVRGVAQGLGRERRMLRWKKMRTIVATLLCALALSAAEPGQRAPGFALMDSKGDLHDLYDFRGKPVIVEFMQTTCPHCAAFAGTLERVQAKYGNKIGDRGDRESAR